MEYALIYRRYAPFATFGGGFGGDNRTSASTLTSGVTARTIGVVLFDSQKIRSSVASSSGSHHPWLGTATGAVAMTVVRSTLAGPGLIGFSTATAGANPLAPGAPPIDTQMEIMVSISPGVMRVNGTVTGDNFPNLEVFLKTKFSGRTALLVDGRTTGGRNTGPATRLWGSHASQVLARISITLSLDASFDLATNTTVVSSTI